MRNDLEGKAKTRVIGDGGSEKKQKECIEKCGGCVCENKTYSRQRGDKENHINIATSL